MSLRLLKLLVNVWWWGLIVFGVVSIAWIASRSPDNLEFAMVGYASDIDTSALGAEDHNGQELRVEFDGPARVKLIPPKGNLTFGHKLICLAVLALVFAACLYFVKQLKDIVLTMDQQDPFVADNARRVRAIGVLTLAFAVFKGIGQLAISGFADSTVIPTGFSLNGRIEVPVGLLIVGVAVVVLSEVFRHGTQIRKDQSLTI